MGERGTRVPCKFDVASGSLRYPLAVEFMKMINQLARRFIYGGVL